MCKKRNSKQYVFLDRDSRKLKSIKIDSCLPKLLKFINGIQETQDNEIRTLSSCCGHGKYNMTIVVKDRYAPFPFELLSGKDIPRKKRFYKKDKQGYYYIPEVQNTK